MKRISRLLITVLALQLGWLSPAVNAQINPVRLKVTKEIKKNRPEVRSSSYGREESQTINYLIELANASATAVNDVQIKWAILYKPRSTYTEVQIVEGEKTCTLGVGQKFICETDPVDLQGTATISSYSGRYKSGYNAQIIGYAVDVLVKGAIVTSDIQPSDTKKRIEQAKKHAAHDSSVTGTTTRKPAE